MKSVFSSVLIFSAMVIMSVSCSSRNETSDEPMIAVITETEKTVPAVTSASSVSSSVTSHLITTSCISSPASSSSDIQLLNPEYAAAEVSMLEAVGNPDYNGEIWIPYVGWTEVNLNKIMYPVSQCIGYEFALEDAAPKMRYDAGIALEVIARTSTGYYRLRGDYYIPCDFLDTVIHEGADPAAATSCEIVTIPVSSVSVPPEAVTEPEDEAFEENDTEY